MTMDWKKLLRDLNLTSQELSKKIGRSNTYVNTKMYDAKKTPGKDVWMFKKTENRLREYLEIRGLMLEDYVIIDGVSPAPNVSTNTEAKRVAPKEKKPSTKDIEIEELKGIVEELSVQIVHLCEELKCREGELEFATRYIEEIKHDEQEKETVIDYLIKRGVR